MMLRHFALVRGLLHLVAVALVGGAGRRCSVFERLVVLVGWCPASDRFKLKC